MHKSLVALAVFPLAVALAAPGCKKKDDEPPPPPAPTATAAPTASAPVVIAVEEDAGSDAATDAATDAAKPTGARAPADPGGLRACCNALQQNAASMPPPNNMYALQAAVLCQSLVAQGAQKSGAMGMIAGALKGAGMPAACR